MSSLLLAVVCPDPGIPANGERDASSFTYNSRATFDCHDGYLLTGESALVCGANGQWSHPTPMCMRKVFVVLLSYSCGWPQDLWNRSFVSDMLTLIWWLSTAIMSICTDRRCLIFANLATLCKSIYVVARLTKHSWKRLHWLEMCMWHWFNEVMFLVYMYVLSVFSSDLLTSRNSRAWLCWGEWSKLRLRLNGFLLMWLRICSHRLSREIVPGWRTVVWWPACL